MKHHTLLLRIFHAKQLPKSVKGNPRWEFTARTIGGPLQEFKTTADVSSAYTCNLSRLKLGEVIRARYHKTASGTLMVDRWDDARSAGFDLSSRFDLFEEFHQMGVDSRNQQAEFARQQADAVNREQDHGQ